MSKIDDTCREVVDKVDGAVACGVVDLSMGMLLGIHNSASYTQTLNELVAAATTAESKPSGSDRRGPCRGAKGARESFSPKGIGHSKEQERGARFPFRVIEADPKGIPRGEIGHSRAEADLGEPWDSLHPGSHAEAEKHGGFEGLRRVSQVAIRLAVFEEEEILQKM